MRTQSNNLGPGAVVWSECPGLWRDPERLGGAWCFDQTRIPVSFLFHNVDEWLTATEYLMVYPMDDGPRKVEGVLRHVAARLRGEPANGRPRNDADPGQDLTGAVDWTRCAHVEQRHGTSGGGQEGPWRFKGLDDEVAELFEHIAAGGTTYGYSSLSMKVATAMATEVVRFIAAELDREWEAGPVEPAPETGAHENPA